MKLITADFVRITVIDIHHTEEIGVFFVKKDIIDVAIKCKRYTPFKVELYNKGGVAVNVIFPTTKADTV